jgi:hypothetical protein
MYRRRFYLAIAIITAALTANAYVDYRLILRNPRELEAVLRRVLSGLLPEYSPEFGEFEITLSERRAVVHDLVLREEDDPDSTLVSVRRAEAVFNLFPPGLEELTLFEPEGLLRIGPDGSTNFETGEGGESELYEDLQVHVLDGRLRIVSDFQHTHQELLITDINADILVTPELELEVAGDARLGALFEPEAEPTDPSPDPPERVPDGLSFVEVIPGVGFTVHRSSTGPVSATIDLADVALTRTLRHLIPAPFQSDVWDQINPVGGEVGVTVRLLHSEADGLRVSTTIHPDGAAIRPQGFPLVIDRITEGRFEVTVAVPPGADGPQLLSVAWENVVGHLGEEGRALSRGSAFPGRDDERLTLFLFIDAFEVALDEDLRRALPEDIRGVYNLFDPQGVVRHGRVTIFKPPFVREPQLSVTVERMDGSVSAAYVDYPIRVQDIQGSFQLREGANVEIHAQGALEIGGRADVEARVMAGELIDVQVACTDVPVNANLLAAMAPATRRFVEPFRPQAGLADVTINVSKPSPQSLVRPSVVIDLKQVLVSPDVFPYPLNASGRLSVTPIFPEGALAPEGDEEGPDPERIDVLLGLRVQADGITNALVEGPLSVDPGQGSFVGDLDISVERVQLSEGLLAASPQGVVEALQPAGGARDVRVHVSRIDQFEFAARGDGLLTRLQAFPYAPGLRVDRVEASRDGDTIRIGHASGTMGSGRFAVDGHVTLPPEGSGDAADPWIDIHVEADGLTLDPQLVAALPEGSVRDDQIAPMDLRGQVNVHGDVRIIPGLGQLTDLTVDLYDVTAHVNHLAPALERLDQDPVRALSGRVVLELPGRVELVGLRGVLLGAPITVSGLLRDEPALPNLALGPRRVLTEEIPSLAREETRPLLDLSIRQVGLVLDETIHPRLPDEAREALETWPTEGLLDLDVSIHSDLLDPSPRVRMRISPRGARAVPDLLPLPVEDLEGTIELLDGEPALIDLTGRLGTGRLRIRRDHRLEAGLPGQGRRGAAFRVSLQDFRRYPEGPLREEFEALLPESIAGLLTTFDPVGPLDLSAAVYVPDDGRAAITWVAEVRPRGLSFSAGLRVEEVVGVVQVSGRLSEMERGSCEGLIRLEEARILGGQRVRNMRAPFQLADGVFSLGLRGSPFVGQVYGGHLAGLVEYTIEDGAYQGWLDVRDADVQTMDREVREAAGKGPADREIYGDLNAGLAFWGGGRGPFGDEQPLAGRGWVKMLESNYVLLPALIQGVAGILDILTGDTDPEDLAWHTMELDYRLTDERIVMETLRMESNAFTLVGDQGYLHYAEGSQQWDIETTLIPFDTDNVVAQLFFGANLLGPTSINVSGKVVDDESGESQLNVRPGIPLGNIVTRAWRALTGSEDER